MKPRIPMTGEIYNQVQIDGTYLPSGWCLLVALAQGQGYRVSGVIKKTRTRTTLFFPGLLTLLWWLRMGMLQH